jgi:hypothetical protein
MARPTSLVLTCALALVVTVCAGLAVELGGDRDAEARERDRALDDAARSALLSSGFTLPSSPALQGVSRELKGSHGVEILHAVTPFELTLAHGTLTGTAPREPELALATVLIADELALLPAALVQRSALRRVLLVRGLREERRPIPSLPNYQGSLLLDVRASASFLRRLLHHEVFHFIDVADDGQVLRDRDWEALNPPGFRYHAGGRAMRSPEAGARVDDLPGFVTLYATSALEEDKAELFAFLMTEPAEMRRLAEHDVHVQRKLARLQELVASLCEEADASFWQRLAEARSR